MEQGDSESDGWSEARFFDFVRRELKGEAFACLLGHQEKLRGHAWMRWGEEVGGPLELETLVREASWKAVERADSYCSEPWSERQGVLGWAFHVGANHIADRLRQEHARRGRGSVGVSTGAQRERAEEVRAAIASLPHLHGEVLTFDLAHEGLGPSAELAEQLEIEVPALCELRREARRRLLELPQWSPPRLDWFTLIRRIGCGPCFAQLLAEEAWGEYQDAPLRPPVSTESSSKGLGPPGQWKTVAMATYFLLERARAGGDHAWEELYRRYRTMLIMQIQSRMRGFSDRRFDAEDVLRDAFARAWEKIRCFEYRGEGSFRSWLSTVVLNDFYNRLKKARGERKHVQPSAEGEFQRAAEEQHLNEELAWLLEAMGTLSEEERNVLIMRDFEGMSFDAVAEILERSRDWVKQTYLRALERLRRQRGD